MGFFKSKGYDNLIFQKVIYLFHMMNYSRPVEVKVQLEVLKGQSLPESFQNDQVHPVLNKTGLSRS